MTTEPTPQPDQAADDRVADWEAFYRDYRKPGYIEGFEITTKLGGGMFGLVFRARRMSIGKDYAIKFLKVDDGEVRRAILSELEQVKYFAQIDHPNLVAIEDRGEVHGIPYLVMAYAGAQTLRDLMPVDDAGAGRVPTTAEKADLLRAFLQSCRGLQALHERSLVHFDIKPANVFLKGGVARLGDYGLSKLVTHSRGSLSMGRGTPYYMAPEMLKRRGDARSDIYSLGVMLYEILCGKVPFAGDSEWEVLRKHETAEPELPDFLTATERGVLLRCLQKEPEDRFESVQDLILALGAPTSTAAAAWNDVRDGATASTNARASAPPPPPRSSTKAAAEENPYKEMADASKKAFRHANEVARDAMREAQKTARKAMKEASVSARKAARQAQDKWRESWQKTRDYSVRRWRTLTQLRKQKKGVDRDLARRVATAVASPDGSFEPKPKSPGLLRRAAYVAGSLALLVLTMVVVWVAVLVPGGNARYSSAQGDRAIPSPRITTANSRGFVPSSGKGLSSKAVFDRIVVPSKFDALVSRVEPPWAKTYLRDPSNAKRQLLEHIEDLRKYAPISTRRRVKEPLPTFSRDGEHPQERGLRDQIVVFARLKSYNSTLARDIASKGPVALAMVAEELTKIDYETRADIAAGGRYHRLLVDATACRDLDFVTRGRTEDVRAANQALGRLWSWFVNEFAHSESCWYAYQKLLR